MRTYGLGEVFKFTLIGIGFCLCLTWGEWLAAAWAFIAGYWLLQYMLK